MYDKISVIVSKSLILQFKKLLIYSCILHTVQMTACIFKYQNLDIFNSNQLLNWEIFPFWLPIFLFNCGQYRTLLQVICYYRAEKKMLTSQVLSFSSPLSLQAAIVDGLYGNINSISSCKFHETSIFMLNF